jgi:hypothetical protein
MPHSRFSPVAFLLCAIAAPAFSQSAVQSPVHPRPFRLSDIEHQGDTMPASSSAFPFANPDSARARRKFAHDASPEIAAPAGVLRFSGDATTFQPATDFSYDQGFRRLAPMESARDIRVTRPMVLRYLL